MSLILFILISKSGPKFTIYVGFNLMGLFYLFYSKLGLYSTNYEIGLFSGLNSKLILLAKVGLKSRLLNEPRIVLT